MGLLYDACNGTGSAFELADYAGLGAQIGAFCDILERPNLFVRVGLMVTSEADFRLNEGREW